jgi:periplasmic divalent cation tolerance protein
VARHVAARAGCRDLQSLDFKIRESARKVQPQLTVTDDVVAHAGQKYKEKSVSSVVIVLTTWPASSDAGAFARTLVDERLAACVNVLPQMQSTYRWKGAIEIDAERQVLIKTSEARLGELEARLRGLHPYEVPEFIMIRADGADAYAAWVAAATQTER